MTAVPIGRFGNREEVAAAVVYLASADAAYVTGATARQWRPGDDLRWTGRFPVSALRAIKEDARFSTAFEYCRAIIENARKMQKRLQPPPTRFAMNRPQMLQECPNCRLSSLSFNVS
jgi:hypothetical protein